MSAINLKKVNFGSAIVSTYENLLSGTTADDTLIGGTGDDTFQGGQGNDILEGSTGIDTYVFSIGDGADIITQSEQNTSNSLDTIQFNNVASTDITGVTKINNDLLISYGASDQITVQDFFSTSLNKIGKFQFSDDVNWSADFVQNSINTNLLAIGGAMSGVIGSEGDKQTFAVSLVQGQTYNFHLNGNTLTDAFLSLLDNQRVVITSNDDVYAGNLNSYINFTADKTGTYYLVAKGLRDKTGSYIITANLDDYSANIQTTGLVNVDGSVSGVIDSVGDHDWFGVSLVQGQTYNFNLNANTLTDPYLSLLDNQGTLITSNDDVYGGNLNSHINFTANTTGTYYLAAKGLRANIGNYKLNANLDDYTSNSLTTGIVSIDDSTTGIIDSVGDQDWFGVDLVQGQNYNFNLNASSLGDSYLSLLDNQGNLIVSNDDVYGGNLNSHINFTADTTGTYYLAAKGLRDKIGSYTVTAHLDDYSQNMQTTGVVTADGSATGVIDSVGDQDWFGVDLVQGQSYNFNLNGNSLTDSYLSFYNNQGALISSNDDVFGGNLNAYIGFTADVTGTYYLGAKGLRDNVGGYTVTVNLDDYSADTLTTGVVDIGNSATGLIDSAGDKDWFNVFLLKGESYDFNLNGISLKDSYLSLLDDQGNLINSNDDGYSGSLYSSIYFKAEATGTYYLSAGGYCGSTGTYIVSVNSHGYGYEYEHEHEYEYEHEYGSGSGSGSHGGSSSHGGGNNSYGSDGTVSHSSDSVITPVQIDVVGQSSLPV